MSLSCPGQWQGPGHLNPGSQQTSAPPYPGPHCHVCLALLPLLEPEGTMGWHPRALGDMGLLLWPWELRQTMPLKPEQGI